MKRCAQCKSLFTDDEYFCELDGTPLEPVENSPMVSNQPPAMSRSSLAGVLIPIGAVGGVLLGVLVVVLYLTITRNDQNETTVKSSNASVAKQQLPPPPLVRSEPLASPSPSPEPSPSPSLSPSPSPQSTVQEVELSSNPISTAPGRSGPVIIKLDSGVTVEADEAWQTGEGIWYRKHGVVTLVDPKHVKSVERVPPPSPSPSAAASPKI